eukprot:TRINITY_DN9865_c0_g2_i1.p1 TRINITY_DN9865_c0_g2~~TRINITY_DN9865_c0_g2_i1.p1  ORF type:complete len:310 (+),score=75.76 TRINITY_DN9865_c0_g2_i1:130-1059(+)
MENMFKQLRVKFSGLGDSSAQTPQNKSGNKKAAHSWLGRQFSGRSQDSSSSDGEFGTVIAASAYAVTSLEEVDSLNQKKTPAETQQTSLSKGKSRKEDNLAGPPDARKPTKRISSELSLKKPAVADKKPIERASPDKQMPEKVMGSVPSVKRTPTFSAPTPNDKAIAKTESGKGKIPKQTVSFSDKPTAPTSNGRDQSRGPETKADIWEKAQMAKIETRYEKLKSTIMSWENEKQTKARRKLEKKERTLELKRARAQREYRNEMERINRIAGGARALAEERKRNDELQTKEKAKTFRTTGNLPVTCFCF